MNKFEQVSSDDHQISLEGRGRAGRGVPEVLCPGGGLGEGGPEVPYPGGRAGGPVQ